MAAVMLRLLPTFRWSAMGSMRLPTFELVQTFVFRQHVAVAECHERVYGFGAQVQLHRCEAEHARAPHERRKAVHESE